MKRENGHDGHMGMAEGVFPSAEQVAVAEAYLAKAKAGRQVTQAVGVAFLFFDCGCTKAAFFNASGSQSTPAVLLGGHEGEACDMCLAEGSVNSQAIHKAVIAWLEPCTLSKQERDAIAGRILGPEMIS